MRESAARAEKLHLTPEEIAFYDALAASESAQQSWAMLPYEKSPKNSRKSYEQM